MTVPADVQDLCKTMSDLGVEPEIIDKARSDLSLHCDKVGNWLMLSSALRNRGHYHASLATYEIALCRFPDSYQAWGNLAILYRDWERYQEALHALQRALDLKPDYVHALESRAMTLERMQRFREAAEGYSAVLRKDPKRPFSWNNLGNCLLFIGQREDAPRCFENANALDPGYLDPLFNLAATYYEGKEFDKAIVAITRFLKGKPNDTEAERLLAKIQKRPEVPDPVLPTPVNRAPMVVRLSTNLDGDGTLAESDLTRQTLVEGHELAAMGRAEAASIVGFRSWDIVHLNKLVREALGRRGHRSPPPEAIFISYRWESDAHKAWVELLAKDLHSRGYHVVFDKFASEEQQPIEIPEFVSRIVQCKTFIAVLTEGYRRRVEVLPGFWATIREDGWVFDEWRCALLLSSMGLMNLVGLWRSGPAIPLPFRKDTVVDVRQSCDYAQAIDDAFPRV